MQNPPPYKLIARLLRDGQVVPFLGAGVNFGCRPSAAKEGEAVEWDEENSPFLPSGRELSRLLASECGFTSRDSHDLDDLAKVASYFVESSARRSLRKRLRELFCRDFAPGPIHRYLAEAAAHNPLLIVTTNYDDLLEIAFRERRVPFDVVIHPADRPDQKASVLWQEHGSPGLKPELPNQLFIDLEGRTVIYKIHGTIDRRDGELGNYVITEEDYEEFLSAMTTGQMVPPVIFTNHFRTRHFLFLGYSLRDWNLRVILRNMKSVLPPGNDQAGTPEEREKLTSWAIQYQPFEWERDLWRARGVKIFDEDINSFVRHLERA